jgi:hypothetical protein
MVHHGLKKQHYGETSPNLNRYIITGKMYQRTTHLYIRPGRKKPGLAFLHKSAIEHIKEFEPFKTLYKK